MIMSTKNYQWTPEQISKLKEYAAQSISRPRIAELLNIPKCFVEAKMNREKIQKPKTNFEWSSQDDKQLLEFLEKGLTICEISDKINRMPWGIFHRCKNLGVISKFAQVNAFVRWDRQQKSSVLERAIRYRLNNIKKRCTKLNIPFTLKNIDVENLWTQQEGKCFYSGLEMSFIIGSLNSLSVDRINCNLGYHINNIVLCLRWVNTMKLNKSTTEFIKMCKLIASRH